MAQKAAAKYDLTQGNILNKLILVSVPIMGTQLMLMAYNLTDMFWLSKVGSDAVAAAGSAGMYLWLSQGLLMFGRMGAEIGVSQSMGKSDGEAASRYSQNALAIGMALGTLFGLGMILFRWPLIGFFNIQEQNVVADAVSYLAITGAAIPLTFLSGSIAGAFNGSGNSRLPFFVNAIGLVINIVLDPVLIFVLDMGIVGAAVATSLAQGVVCLLFLAAVKYPRTSPFGEYRFFRRIHLPVVGQIFRWSLPIATEAVLFTFLSMVISRFIADWGADALAVQKIGSQIESMSWLVAGGFSTAITAFVGQNFGAGRWSRIHRGMRIATLAIAGWGVLVTLVLFFLGGFLFSLFFPQPEILALGIPHMQILAACQIPLCFESAAMGGFRGIGKTLPPTISSVACNTLRVPMAYFLSLTPLGLNGIWWGISLGCVMRGVWAYGWYLAEARRRPREDVAPAQ